MSAAKTLDTYLDTRTLSALDMIERMSADDWRASAVQWARYAAVFDALDTDTRKRAADTRQRTPKRKQRTGKRRKRSGRGYKKRMDARERIAKYLQRHPAAVAWSARDLAHEVGVGKSTAADVLRSLRDVD